MSHEEEKNRFWKERGYLIDSCFVGMGKVDSRLSATSGNQTLST